MTGSEQIEALKHLSQQSAAWLLSVTPRALRDSDAPRKPGGSYDARELLDWAQSRITPAKLSDDELESVFRIIESTELLTSAMLGVLDELKKKHGAAGLLAFVITFTEESRASIKRYPPATQDIELATDEFRRREADRITSEALRISTTCEACGKLRCGRRWSSGDPPEDHIIVEGLCPACTRKRDRAEKRTAN